MQTWHVRVFIWFMWSYPLYDQISHTHVAFHLIASLLSACIYKNDWSYNKTLNILLLYCFYLNLDYHNIAPFFIYLSLNIANNESCNNILFVFCSLLCYSESPLNRNETLPGLLAAHCSLPCGQAPHATRDVMLWSAHCTHSSRHHLTSLPSV